MSTILDRIAASKRLEIEAKARLGVYSAAEAALASVSRPVVSLSRALLADGPGIIAEFKRRSPSRSDIFPKADAAVVVPSYEEAGASACSVLTDTQYFGGSLTDLAVARSHASLPLLRKDFILDPRQIAEARLCGADAILLIAALLSAREVSHLTSVAHSMDLEVVLEIHHERELDKVTPEADIIGVNNRNLDDFSVDIATSERLFGMLPAGAVKISESGINSPADVTRLRHAGFRGFLIGTAFMETHAPGTALRDFINGIDN